MSSSNEKNKVVDFDLYGIVGIRLINPTDNDVKKNFGLFSAFKTELSRKPDITIKFKKTWELGKITYLGLNDVAFNSEGFYFLSNGRIPLQVKIPFDQIGGECEIICKQDIPGIPLLQQIISLTFLKKNYLPVHASAFSYKEQGTLVFGWTKGGKTEALLSFMNYGADFIGDETVIVSPSDKKMFGIPVPISIWEWQFSEIPNLVPKLSTQKKILFKGVHFIERLHKLFSVGKLKKNAVLKLLNDALPALRRQLNIRVTPEKLFGNKVKWQQIEIEKIILMMSYSLSEISEQECEKNEIIERIITSSLYEFDSFFNYYEMFKFAYPGLKNDFLERIDETYYSLLPGILSDVQSYKVFHPYPVSFEKLYNTMKSIFDIKKNDN